MNNGGSPMNNMAMPTMMEKPCSAVPPVLVSSFYGTTVGGNAVVSRLFIICKFFFSFEFTAQLVGLLSSIVAIGFLLICLYYLAFRRRYAKEMSDGSMPMPMTDKMDTTTIPVTSASRSVSKTVLNEPGKETIITTFTEQTSGTNTGGDVAINMPTMMDGEVTPTSSDGLLVNGNTDQSELRLLQHEHN